MAADYGLQTSVVNWWATWPAPSGAGVVLSDRATLRLERGGRAGRGDRAAVRVRALLSRSGRPFATRRAGASSRRSRAPTTRTDRSCGARPSRTRCRPPWPRACLPRDGELRAIYLPGLDIAQHNLVGSAAGAGLPASALAARVEALERYYVFLDGLLESLVAGPRPVTSSRWWPIPDGRRRAAWACSR